MSGNVIDIIERFQARHALQEERETQNSPASTNGAVAPGMPQGRARAPRARGLGAASLQALRVG